MGKGGGHRRCKETITNDFLRSCDTNETFGEHAEGVGALLVADTVAHGTEEFEEHELALDTRSISELLEEDCPDGGDHRGGIGGDDGVQCLCALVVVRLAAVELGGEVTEDLVEITWLGKGATGDGELLKIEG